MAADGKCGAASTDNDIALREAIALLERLRDEYDLLIQSSECSAADATYRQILFICEIIDARTTRPAEAEGLETTITAADKILGLAKVKVIHANDSKGVLDSHLDRHDLPYEHERPAGRVALSAFVRPSPASSRLARPRICGVER